MRAKNARMVTGLPTSVAGSSGCVGNAGYARPTRKKIFAAGKFVVAVTGKKFA
jgi:hypothetical protein